MIEPIPTSLRIDSGDEPDETTGTEIPARRLAMHLGPWGGSAAVHGLILIVLLLWSIPIIQRGNLNLTAFSGLADDAGEELTFSLDEVALEVPDTEIETALDTVEPIESDLIEPVLDGLLPDSELPDLLPQDDGPEAGGNGTPTSSLPVAGGSVSDATTVEAAVDRIAGGIRGQLENGDVLVVWLLDSSLSLKDDRQRVATRLRSFLDDIHAGDGQREYELKNAVATYGKGFRVRVSPTGAIDKVLAAIESSPADRSGFENVFGAIEKTVARYRREWKSQMMVVVWTDESGDDTQLLDQTIARCQKAKVAVSVVGPSAVLGAETGFHSYTDPKSNMTYQLPVKRGPDSVVPERLRLGYWFRTRPPRGFGRRGRSPSWYGGQDLAGIASGFSPHALTRLATETGGTYTIFDRPEDRAPFDFRRMIGYAPGYSTATNYQKELRKYPLRRAVHEAVKVTYQTNIVPPDMMFFGEVITEPSYTISALYFSPSQFRSKLKSNRSRLDRQIRRYAKVLESSLSKVSDDGVLAKGLEYEYGNEPSPRWKAWYDLTRGRLLANRVRCEEYRLTMDWLQKKGSLNESTNGIVLDSQTQMRSSSEFLAYSEEARDLLTRCAEDNSGTPWAYLAERELQHGLGVSVRQLQLRPTGAVQQRGRPNLPKF